MKNEFSSMLLVCGLFVLVYALVQTVILPYARFWVASVTKLILNGVGVNLALEGDTFHLGTVKARVGDSCLRPEVLAVTSLLTTVAYMIAYGITHQMLPTLKLTGVVFLTVFLGGIFFNILRIATVILAYLSLSPPPVNPVEAWDSLHETVSTLMWMGYGGAWAFVGARH